MSTDMSQSGSTGESPEAPVKLRPLPARAIGLVTSPRSVFEELKTKPAWFWTLLVTFIAIAVYLALTFESVLFPAMLEQADLRDTTGQQIEMMEDNFATIRISVVVMYSVIFVATVVVQALTYLGICALVLGGKMTVRQALAVCAHAALINIPRMLLIGPVQVIRGDPGITLGPGIFFPITQATDFAGRYISTVLSGFDLFFIWGLGLTILGFSVISGLPTNRVAVGVGFGYVALVFVFSALAAAMG